MFVYEEYFLLFCRLVLGITFLFSALSKVRNISQFQQTIKNFQIMPRQFVKASSIFFLSGELAVILFMVLDIGLLYLGFLLAILLLLIFSAALISVLRRKISTPCNCFGSHDEAIKYHDVIRNAGLLLFAVVGLGISAGANIRFVNIPPQGVGLIGLVAVVFVFIWINIGEIIQLFK